MSRKANPTLLGVFILAGLALGVGALLLFSSSRIFTRTKTYVLYFDASLKGLDPGTAVKFRGVTIGSVKEVLVHFNQAPTDASLPVIIQVNESLLKKRSDETFNLTDDNQFSAFVKRGLRGRLEAQSLLTGLLYVDLDFLPDAPAPTCHQLTRVYREIPTAPSNIQRLMDNLYRVDLAGLSKKLNDILAKLDLTLGQMEMKEINRGLTNLLASLNAIASSPDLTNALASAQQTFAEIRLLSANVRLKLDTLVETADSTLTESRETMTEVRHGVQEVRDMIAPNASLRHELDLALDQLAEAARSVGALAEFLSRHPNALLSGRKAAEPKR